MTRKRNANSVFSIILRSDREKNGIIEGAEFDVLIMRLKMKFIYNQNKEDPKIAFIEKEIDKLRLLKSKTTKEIFKRVHEVMRELMEMSFE